MAERQVDPGRAEEPLMAYGGRTASGAEIVVAVGDDRSSRSARLEDSRVAEPLPGRVSATDPAGGQRAASWLSQPVPISGGRDFAHRPEAIIDGDLTQRIPLRGTGDDLDRLAETLNRMLDRMDKLLESVRQSNNIAHDLRTPLSRLGQRLEDARAQAPLRRRPARLRWTPPGWKSTHCSAPSPPCCALRKSRPGHSGRRFAGWT